MGDGNNPSMKLGILKAYRLNGKDEKEFSKAWMYNKFMNKLIFATLFFLSLTGSSMIIDNVDDIRADWRINSDRVMGGVSDVFLDELNDSDISFIDYLEMLEQLTMEVLYKLS